MSAIRLPPLTFPTPASKPCTSTWLEVFRIGLSWAVSLLSGGLFQKVSQKQGGWHWVSEEIETPAPHPAGSGEMGWKWQKGECWAEGL